MGNLGGSSQHVIYNVLLRSAKSVSFLEVLNGFRICIWFKLVCFMTVLFLHRVTDSSERREALQWHCTFWLQLTLEGTHIQPTDTVCPFSFPPQMYVPLMLICCFIWLTEAMEDNRGGSFIQFPLGSLQRPFVSWALSTCLLLIWCPFALRVIW